MNLEDFYWIFFGCMKLMDGVGFEFYFCVGSYLLMFVVDC